MSEVLALSCSMFQEYLGTERSSVMLKDKWRTMLKNNDVQRIMKKRGKK